MWHGSSPRGSTTSPLNRRSVSLSTSDACSVLANNEQCQRIWRTSDVPVTEKQAAAFRGPGRPHGGYPECRAAVSMVTGHQQSDSRVGRRGRESRCTLVVKERQTSSPRTLRMNGRSPGGRLVFCELSRRGSIVRRGLRAPSPRHGLFTCDPYARRRRCAETRFRAFATAARIRIRAPDQPIQPASS